MENKEKSGVNNFVGKGENLSDNIVSMFYSEGLVKWIESLDFMKSLIGSSFIKAINDFGKGWFKQVFVFVGYLAIIFGLIGAVMQVIYLLDFLGAMRWMIASILQIIMSLIGVVTGFGMIKFKKWFPFIALVGYIGQIIVMFFTPVYGIGYSFYSRPSIASIVIGLAIFVIGYALILKNKDLFKN
ncbi:hypothetical protein EOM39_04915 [Candidatus Gracilibacteria bacterium]|nr:hypothetical protein [Candidatus Gracilibacteria bacterium]